MRGGAETLDFKVIFSCMFYGGTLFGLFVELRSSTV